jgi:hypothetical protein
MSASTRAFADRRPFRPPISAVTGPIMFQVGRGRHLRMLDLDRPAAAGGDHVVRQRRVGRRFSPGLLGVKEDVA